MLCDAYVIMELMCLRVPILYFKRNTGSERVTPKVFLPVSRVRGSFNSVKTYFVDFLVNTDRSFVKC